VLEHIEPEYLDNVLDDLKRVTKVAGLFIICLVPANKVLGDGRNAHICLLTAQEWLDRLEPRFKIQTHHVTQSSEDPPRDMWLHVTVEAK